MKRVIGFLLVCLMSGGCGEVAAAPTPTVEVTVGPTAVPEAEETERLLTVYGTAEEAYCAILQGDFSGLDSEDKEHYEELYRGWMPGQLSQNGWEYALIDVDEDGILDLFVRMADSIVMTGMFHWVEGRLVCWYWDEVEMTSYNIPLKNGELWGIYRDSNWIFRYDSDGNYVAIEDGPQWHWDEPHPPGFEERYVNQAVEEKDWHPATDLSPLLPEVTCTLAEGYERVVSGDFSLVSSVTEDKKAQMAQEYATFGPWRHDTVDMDGDGISELFMQTNSGQTGIFHWAEETLVCWSWNAGTRSFTNVLLSNGRVWTQNMGRSYKGGQVNYSRLFSFSPTGKRVELAASSSYYEEGKRPEHFITNVSHFYIVSSNPSVSQAEYDAYLYENYTQFRIPAAQWQWGAFRGEAAVYVNDAPGDRSVVAEREDVYGGSRHFFFSDEPLSEVLVSEIVRKEVEGQADCFVETGSLIYHPALAVGEAIGLPALFGGSEPHVQVSSRWGERWRLFWKQGH